MSYQAFLKEIEKGLPAPAYLFYAQDPFLQREALEAIKRLVPPDEKDFNLHVFDLSAGEEDATFSQILEVSNTASFLGGRRFTVSIINLQKLIKKDYERLLDYLSDPPPGSVFVILHNGALSREAREKFRALKPLPLDIRGSEIVYWLKQRARARGLELSTEASDYLTGLIGPDLGLLSAEIEKISLLGKEKITVDDISDIVTGERLYSIFDLVDAIRARDADRIFRIYKILRETADDYSLIGALNWQYARSMGSHADRAEKEYLFRVFELLNSADIDIKSSGRNFPMEYLLVRLLRAR